MNIPEIYAQYDLKPCDQGYYRHPTTEGKQVIFVSEDDLWTVPINGGVARRLTGAQGQVSSPAISPDGQHVAYTSTEHGCPEVFVMAVNGGPPTKLTYSGARRAEVCGWSPEGTHIIFRSALREPFGHALALYQVPAAGGGVERLTIGRGHRLVHAPQGAGRLVARYGEDLARWKRYRGGMAGQLWIDAQGDGQWTRLLAQETAGICRPMWIGDRIYFISDRDGTGNIYSCDPAGDDLQRHSDHDGHYARFASHHGATIVYVVAGQLMRLDTTTETSETIAVDYHSPRPYRAPKYVDAQEYLDSYSLHPRGHCLAVTTRGKAFNFGNWEGAVRQTGKRFGVRYRLATYIGDGQRLLVVSDDGGEEFLEIHDAHGDGPSQPLEFCDDQGQPLSLGHPVDLAIAPDGEQALLTNHRFELFHLRLDDERARRIDKSPARRIAGIAWAGDSRHVAYGFFVEQSLSLIKICDLDTGQIEAVTSGQFRDRDPVFDPDGRYLYFLSHRHFDPVFDQHYFDLSFPQGIKPCVVTLQADEQSPFTQTPRPLSGDDDDSDQGDETKDGTETVNGTNIETENETNLKDSGDDPLQIDFAGMARRVQVFPVAEGNYDQIDATADRVYWSDFPVEKDSDESDGGSLKYWDLEKKKTVDFAEDITSFALDRQGKTIALWLGDDLRVVRADDDGPDEDDDLPGRESGIVDLERIAPAIDPRAEWCQMLREAWRLMRDHFWRDDMNGVDWPAVWRRYKKLLPRVSTRSEFSDLAWTMQGELGTSHAYELGGDYDIPPQYQPGFLGADLRFDPDWRADDLPQAQGAYHIEHIPAGDPWQPRQTSPLLRPGVDIDEGDVIVAVNGQFVTARTSMGELLAAQADREVELLVADADGANIRPATVNTLRDEQALRYRHWVATNRQQVHQATGGRIGYVHIPDMSQRGYAEFHRQYLHEHTRQGLIVDVRVNAGGFVSQLILEKLARKPMGLELVRHGSGQGPTYPAHVMDGPIVAVTDAIAGSDGDVFSHCFKLMELGPLIGTRTWGGTVGIWPRHRLADGSITTQPEYAFWLRDVGFGLENHGAEPDIVVDNPPECDGDRQLQRAIDEVVDRLAAASPLTLPDTP